MAALTLHLVHFPGRLARLEEARAGRAPTEFLFGAVELERAGHVVVHHEVDPDAPASRLAVRGIDRLTGLGHLPPHVTAAVLAGTRRLLPALRDADVVVATTTPTALGLAVWKRAGLLRRPLVGIVSGVVNRPWRRTRRLTTLPLLRAMEVALYGPGELELLRALDRRLAPRLHVLGFGVDASFWTPAQAAGDDGVLAVGNDSARDWATLVRAAETVPAPVRVLTRHEPPALLPANVHWREADWHRRVVSDAEMRGLYRRAAVVAVPLRDVAQPSGQSVTLQAMACGCAVVLTRTRGLWDAGIADAGAVALVPPGDAAALAGEVRALLADPERRAALGERARSYVTVRASVAGFAERLESLCARALRAG